MIEHIDMVLGKVLDVKLDVDLDLLIGMNAWNYYPIRGGSTTSIIGVYD